MKTLPVLGLLALLGTTPLQATPSFCGRIVDGTLKRDADSEEYTLDMTVSADGGLRKKHFWGTDEEAYLLLKGALAAYKARSREGGSIGAEGVACVVCKDPKSYDHLEIPCEITRAVVFEFKVVKE